MEGMGLRAVSTKTFLGKERASFLLLACGLLLLSQLWASSMASTTFPLMVQDPRIDDHSDTLGSKARPGLKAHPATTAAS